MVRAVNRAMAQHQLSAAGAEQVVTLMRRFDTVLGLVAEEQTPLARDVEVLMEERQRARQARDFARADALRAQIQERGYVVEDTPQGPRLKRL
jgi:cysteinyl-tRNA synthetase